VLEAKISDHVKFEFVGFDPETPVNTCDPPDCYGRSGRIVDAFPIVFRRAK